jgi:sugar phosphate isomerase/epimerase
MAESSSRREFLATLGGATAAGMFAGATAFGAARTPVSGRIKLSVISDELTQDVGRAFEVASKEFGLSYVELRGVWNKNIVILDEKEIAELKRLLQRFNLQVTDIASPLFKTDFPGAPRSKYSPAKPQYGADFPFEKQGEVLERAAAVGKALGTNRIRCFDFWRLDNPKPYREGMNESLRKASADAAKLGFTLLLENEFECNSATGAEAVETLKAVPAPNFKLNWDPGNAAFQGEIAYPDGYAGLPKDRIGHMHCKDVSRKPDGSFEWAAMGRGIIDYAGQFKAMLADGYTGTMSLETHWHGAGISMEESSRQSMAGLKDLLIKAGGISA